MKKEKLTIWVCEDDEALWDVQEEALRREFPKANIKFFLNAVYARRAGGSPDFIIMDVGGIMGFGVDIISLTTSNIEGLSELHPGAIFIVFSFIGAYAMDVYEELEPDLQSVSKWVDGMDWYSKIPLLIKKNV